MKLSVLICSTRIDDFEFACVGEERNGGGAKWERREERGEGRKEIPDALEPTSQQ